MTVVQQTVEDGRSRRIVAEKLSPVLNRPVGSDHRAFPPVKITHPLPFVRDIFTWLACAFRLGLAFRHGAEFGATPVASKRYFDIPFVKDSFAQRPQSSALLGYLLISLLTCCPNA